MMINLLLKKNYLLVFFCLICFTASADEVLKSKFRHYSTEDGLSHDGVLCMIRDRDGFMWFGTWDGINRFDGNSFVTYKARPGDRSSLKNNKIRNIIEDKAGFLWVKTYDNKVYRFDKNTEDFYAINKTSDGQKLNTMVVEKMLSTSLGDTWLITEAQGLVSTVYNKSTKVPLVYSFTPNNPKKAFTIPSKHINFIYEDAAKHVWAGSDKGLVCFNKTNNVYQHFLNFKNGSHIFDQQKIFTCAGGNQQMLYFGTASGELVMYNRKTRTFRTKKINAKVKVNAIKVAQSGMVYITTSGGGLWLLNSQTLVLSALKGSEGQTFFSIYEDKKENIWLEPEFNGIVRYHPQNKTFTTYRQKKERDLPESMLPKSVLDKNYTVFEDVNGRLWTSLKSGGFGYYNTETDRISYLYNEPGAADQQLSNDVEVAYSDPTGVLWLSTRFGGIHKFIFPENNFKHTELVPDSKNRYDNEVRGIYEDSKQRVWVATKIGQLYVLDKGGERLSEASLFTNIKGDEFGSVYAIKESKDGRIWLGTKGQGLVVLTPTNANKNVYSAQRYVQNNLQKGSINNNLIYAILEDKAGRIWIGTFGGGINEAVSNNGSITFRNQGNYFDQYPIATCNVIRHLEEGENGIIWIATTDGLLRFNPKEEQKTVFHRSLKIPGDAHSLGNNDVQFIYKDQKRQMWIGTFGGGLNKVLGKPTLQSELRFEVFTKDQGLPNDIVLNITDDGYDDLWMATENGLSEFNVRKKTFRNFDSFDGLPKAGFSESASFKAKSGALFFGCINGFVSFYPNKVSSRKFNASLALTGLQLYNNDVFVGAAGSPLKQSLNETKKLTLKYDQNVINIDYSVLDYRTTHNFSYAYILEGFDKDWHYVKNQKRASYTKLPPGNYTFKVKSLNPDLFLQTPEKTLAITILPPFWFTIWAYLFYLVLAIIAIIIARNIIITMIKLRNSVVIEHKLTELKLQFFTNISHELRTPLTLIVNPLRQLAKTENLSQKGQEYMNVVNKNANRMVRFINQLLDFRKIQSGNIQLKISEVELIAFVKGIAAYFNEMALDKNINFLITSDVEECLVWIDEEKVDIVLYNLLSNAFKFTPQGKNISVNINCSASEDTFSILIKDEGLGIPEDKLKAIFELYFEGENHDHSQKGTGIGLALSKEIMTHHKGSITATNHANGASFEVVFKKGNAHYTAADIGASDFHAQHDFSELFPLTKVNAEPQIENKENDGLERSLVLLVEDNTDLRQFLADQLLEFYRVIQAADGAEGLKQASQHLPDLIISDVMMPNMDGIHMLDKLRHQTITSHIPVILLTAKSSVENQINGLKYGADFYITKPFHVDHILACMENLIKQRRHLYESFVKERKTLKLEPSEVVITSKDEAFLKEVIAIVEQSMSDPKFNIDAVAVAIGMGRTTFYKKLKCLSSQSPVEFVRDMRLKRGKQLMDAGGFSISEIAYQIGFSSAGYFSTCFKEAYKISPSDYLKEKEG